MILLQTLLDKNRRTKEIRFSLSSSTDLHKKKHLFNKNEKLFTWQTYGLVDI